MNLLKKYLKENKTSFTLSVLAAIFGVVAGLVSYILMAQILVGLIEGVTDKAMYFNKAIWIMALLFIKEVFHGISTSISHTTAFKILKDIRVVISEKLFKMPLGDIENIKSGKLKDILVDQVDHMETSLAHIVPEATAGIVGPILLFIYMIKLDWRLALISLIPLVIGIICLMSMMNKSYQEQYAKSVKIGQDMNNAIVEYINGIEVIKTFNQSDKSYKKYSDAVYNNASFYYNWMKSCMFRSSIGRCVSPMGIITILPLGIYLLIKGDTDLSTVLTILVLSFATVESIIKVVSYVDDMSRIGTITGEIENIINSRELAHIDSKLGVKNNSVEFKSVDFAYDEENKVFEDLNLKIDENSYTALVGPSGSGKSTLAKLIAGFWDVDSGRIEIGGVDTKEISLEKLANLVSYVSQDNYLFDISIRENIRMAKPGATDKEVENIAEKSGCAEFINNLEQGYDTVVGEAGGHLSGGERQRVSIARAMLKDAPIVILDEATAYIDPENEVIIQEAISNLVKDKTLIILAHRLRTIIDADKIIVLKDGKINNIGKHKELLEKSNLYAKMWDAAVKGDE